MCNKDHLHTIPLSALNGYISRRIEAYIATLLRPYDLGTEQMFALAILNKKSCINVSTLSEFLLKDKTTTSRLITSLESKGFVKKCYNNKKDKRIVHIEITKVGQEKIKEIESSQILNKANEIFENTLDAHEKEMLRSMFIKALEVLDEKS